MICDRITNKIYQITRAAVDSMHRSSIMIFTSRLLDFKMNFIKICYVLLRKVVAEYIQNVSCTELQLTFV